MTRYAGVELDDWAWGGRLLVWAWVLYMLVDTTRNAITTCCRHFAKSMSPDVVENSKHFVRKNAGAQIHPAPEQGAAQGVPEALSAASVAGATQARRGVGASKVRLTARS